MSTTAGPGTEHLRDLPRRAARAYEELLTPRPFNPTTFPYGDDELVLARDIPVRSLCPVLGVAQVGYLAGDRILGLSKPAWVVEHFAVTSSLHGLLRDDARSGAEFLSLAGGRA